MNLKQWLVRVTVSVSFTIATLGNAWAEQNVELVGNVYCRGSTAAGERPWGGVRVSLKGHQATYGESEPEHGRFRLTLPETAVLDRKVTLVYTQSNLLLAEVESEFSRDDTLVLSGRPTVQLAPKIFLVPYCVELETPRLREMVRALVERISHRAAMVQAELVRAHSYGTEETSQCLDDALSRLDAHLRHAESRVPYFIDALGDDMLRARRELTAIKIADERAQELAEEADYCLTHHAPHPAQDASRYLPDLTISPSGLSVLPEEANYHPAPWNVEPPSRAVAHPEGAVVLAAGTALLAGYDSNLLQAQDGSRLGGLVLRPTGHIALKYFDKDALLAAEPTDLVSPRFDGRLSVSGLLLSAVSGDGRSLRSYNNLAVSADALTRFVSTGPLTALLLGQFQRRVEPNNEPEYTGVFGRNYLGIGSEGLLQIGSGRFEIGAGYNLYGVLSDNSPESQNDRVSHRFALHERLRFLPETALVHETDVRIQRYTNAATALNDSSQLRSRLGLVGMLGERLGFHALAGWAMSDYVMRSTTASNFDGLLLAAKLEWYFGPVANSAYGNEVPVRPSLSVYYDRDYRDNVFTDFYRRDRVAVSLTLTDGHGVLGQIRGGVSHVSYPNLVSDLATNPFLGQAAVTGDSTENRVDLGASLQYQVFRRFHLFGSADFHENLSNVVGVLKDGTIEAQSLGFKRLQFFGGAVYAL